MVGVLLSCGGPGAAAVPPVKVGVYNVHSCVGTDGNTDYDRIATVIRSAAPDVVGLNEVRRFILGAKQDQEIASRLGAGYTSVFGRLFTPGLIADYGNALVTRHEVVSSQTHLFSKSPDLEQRGLLRVTLRRDGELVHVFVTHMGLNFEERRRHTDEILAIMADFTTGTRILMGDFNEMPTASSVTRLASIFDDAAAVYGLGPDATFSVATSPRRIDYIFLDKALAATSCHVPLNALTLVASDHLPVFASVVDPAVTAPVTNQLTAALNGVERLAATDTTAADPDAYTRGAPVISTSGGASTCTAVFDDLRVRRFVPEWTETFQSTAVGSAPADWARLYISPDGTATAHVQTVGPHHWWRQQSSKYVKYHFAPTVYPEWREYEFRARLKTISFGGGLWRMNVLNYPAADTAYDTYKLEVRELVNQAPQARLMKGAAALASVVLADVDVDPRDWNAWAVRVTRRPAASGQVANEVSAWANGRRILRAVDATEDNPDAYTQGSVVLVTVGGADGDCHVLADDLQVRRLEEAWSQDFDAEPSADWRQLYATPETAHSAVRVPAGGAGHAWRQSSAQYLKYHHAPVPYPEWQDTLFSARVRTEDLGGGKWRLKAYNFPSTDTAYETYKLEVRHTGGGPEMRLMRGATGLAAVSFATMGADASVENEYELGVFTHDTAPTLIRRLPSADVSDWKHY